MDSRAHAQAAEIVERKSNNAPHAKLHLTDIQDTSRKRLMTRAKTVDYKTNDPGLWLYPLFRFGEPSFDIDDLNIGIVFIVFFLWVFLW